LDSSGCTAEQRHVQQRRSVNGQGLRRRPSLACCIIAGALGAGCAGGGPIFAPVDTPPRWPTPPERERVVYEGELERDTDLKPEKSVLDGLGAAIFGNRDARTMLTPVDVATDDRDRVFVCDSNAQVVHVFDLRTRNYAQWRPTGEGFSQPVALTVDSERRLLVVDSVAAVIDVFDENGAFAGVMGKGALKRPVGIAFDKVGKRILVVDTVAHQLISMGLDGVILRRVGGRGVGPGEFNFPTYVAVDSKGDVFVSDSLNFRVQKLSPDLKPIRMIGEKGDLPGYFGLPKGVAVDSDDNLYVVDAHFEAVQVFDNEGRLLLSLGREGQGPGEFWLPAGMHIDADDRIWIADSYNRRVQLLHYIREASP